MAVDRMLPTDEAYELIEMTRAVADKLLEPGPSGRNLSRGLERTPCR